MYSSKAVEEGKIVKSTNGHEISGARKIIIIANTLEAVLHLQIFLPTLAHKDHKFPCTMHKAFYLNMQYPFNERIYPLVGCFKMTCSSCEICMRSKGEVYEFGFFKCLNCYV